MAEEDTRSTIYAGGLPYELTEGDIICVFSQYGEIHEITLNRDKETGKSRGFCFLKFEDPRSCELAVDNFNGATIVGRKIKVSFATNTNAVRARKPNIVAPTEDSRLPEVEFPRLLPVRGSSPSLETSQNQSTRDSLRERRGDSRDRFDKHRSKRDSDLRHSDDSSDERRYDRHSSSRHKRHDSRDRKHRYDRDPHDSYHKSNDRGVHLERSHRYPDEKSRDRSPRLQIPDGPRDSKHHGESRNKHRDRSRSRSRSRERSHKSRDSSGRHGSDRRHENRGRDEERSHHSDRSHHRSERKYRS